MLNGYNNKTIDGMVKKKILEIKKQSRVTLISSSEERPIWRTMTYGNLSKIITKRVKCSI